ncbi:YhcN/YlaJ family sporulation lipoprotein [Paenibacillus wynnii]|uniref:YhcN/YlaJ family sporulation lipoprotein n=1 Tax=Paenibacillus wynnii TaxID=268407 RepID=UPI0027943F85|nr:YhcN/YlaJ family sporulation lipoprotein [Paenibacillus wynnii]MDQ0194561.1 hypothetical protein [Paenibacillus wynnii]
MLRSTISRSLAVALLLGMVGVTGCGTNDAAGNNNVRTNNVQTAKDGRLNVNSVKGRNGTDNVTRLQMSQDLADRITAMRDVRSANVLVAGNKAYVALTLDEAGTGTRSGRATDSSPRTLATGRNSGGMLGTGGSLTGRGGTTSGMDGTTYGMDGTMTGRSGTMTGIGGAMPGTGGVMNGTAGGSGAAGNMGTGSMGTYGMGTGGMGTRGVGTYGAGTGGMGTGGMGNMGAADADTLPRDLKDKVTAEIKRNAPQIKTVYVSDNPEFVQRVNGYADNARGGYPLQGFVQEFSSMVERIFPGNNTNR